MELYSCAYYKEFSNLRSAVYNASFWRELLFGGMYVLTWYMDQVLRSTSALGAGRYPNEQIYKHLQPILCQGIYW